MDFLAAVLQHVGYYITLLYPHVPTEILTIAFAVTPIFAGAHAGLKAPTSAAKRRKVIKTTDDTDTESEESILIPEAQSLSLTDAALFPIGAGLTLTGLYYLITHFDPALISKILNWQFIIMGTLAVSTMSTDFLGLLFDMAFPKAYYYDNITWYVQTHKRNHKAPDGRMNESPLPGLFSALPLPESLTQFLWSLREKATGKVMVKVYIWKFLRISTRLNLQTLLATMFAVGLQTYMLLVETPWYLNNVAGMAFVYTMLQVISPSTPSVGSLLLAVLFFYDIYFVFYTPIMVAVATKLDIPAKILIPRPGGMGLLGLGDIFVPGIQICFALKFDLWLHYFYQQRERTKADRDTPAISDEEPDDKSESKGKQLVKSKYEPATGNWGTRFWTGSRLAQQPKIIWGTSFSKPYFNATLTGYILGMLCTLVAMVVSGRGQPALLYLSPSVLGALYLTALKRGELKLLWNYSPDEEKDDKKQNDESKEKPKEKKPQKDKMEEASSKGTRFFYISLSFANKPSKTNALPAVGRSESPPARTPRSSKAKTLPKGWTMVEEPATPTKNPKVEPAAASSVKRAERARRRETLKGSES
ncbi:uncharacterized protein KY384_006336 [Bacidia gigantensis]|uniref:uncharacterized protein n=1 Tax=Bacidia gigantensis TaxID=2732470 RepID=UPI001D03E703|nr:uncharacterized protein KY384_006336 [Bacidia gigantensis]KAG8528649.1 hypothetical protein KY384_006336 [Bacidia gigantensis]